MLILSLPCLAERAVGAACVKLVTFRSFFAYTNPTNRLIDPYQVGSLRIAEIEAQLATTVTITRPFDVALFLYRLVYVLGFEEDSCASARDEHCFLFI